MIIESQNSRLNKLDYLRGIASLMVVVQHLDDHLDAFNFLNPNDFIFYAVKHLGARGIAIFFVLTGFLFTLLSNGGQKPMNYKLFMQSRFWRIAPLFLFLLMAVVAIYPKDIVAIVSNVLVLNLRNVNNLDIPFFKALYPVWTIGVEFKFYFMLPLLFIILNRNGVKALLGLILVTALLREFTTVVYGVNENFNLLFRLDNFLWGIVAGYAYINYKHKWPKRIGNLLLQLFLIVALMLFLALRGKYIPFVLHFTIEGFIVACFIPIYLHCAYQLPKIADAVLGFLGKISYSIYLMHAVVLYYTQAIVAGLNLSHSLFLILIFILVIGVSTLTYAFIEKPFMAMKKPYFIN